MDGVILPVSRSEREIYEAPTITLAPDHLLLDGLPVTDPVSPAEQHRAWLPSLVRRLGQGRALWKQLNPGKPFHGSANLCVDRRVSSRAIRAVILAAGEAGFPNVSFVARRAGDPSAFTRVFVDGRIPGTRNARKERQEADLHVMPAGERVTLMWRGPEGTRTIESTPRGDLASAVSAQWKEHGLHDDANDKEWDRLFIHTAPEAPFSAVFPLFEAVHEPVRYVRASDGTLEEMPAFDVTFYYPSEELAEHREALGPPP